MNTLNISFSYKYAIKAASINWYDIFFAIENGFLPYQSAIEKRCGGVYLSIGNKLLNAE
jgi:hypothetical protein